MHAAPKEHDRGLPRIIVGGIQFSPEDPLPSPMVAVSYPSEEEALAGAEFLLSLQNGSKPFQSGPPVYMGDTNIRVRFRPSGKPAPLDVLVEVFAYRDPKDLTCAFVAASLVSKEHLKAFHELVDLQRSYTVSVAHGERVLTRALSLIKYTIDERGVR